MKLWILKALAASVLLTVLCIWAALHQLWPQVLALPVLLLVGWLWYRNSFPVRATRVLCTLWNRHPKPGEEMPKLRWSKCRRNRYTWLCAWKTPTQAVATGFIAAQESIEKDLKCAVEVWEKDGLVWMRFGINPLPKRVEYSAFYG